MNIVRIGNAVLRWNKNVCLIIIIINTDQLGEGDTANGSLKQTETEHFKCVQTDGVPYPHMSLHIHTDIHTHMQIHTQTYSVHVHTHTHTHTHTDTDTQTNIKQLKQSDRHRDRQIHTIRQTDTERQTDRETDRQIHTGINTHTRTQMTSLERLFTDVMYKILQYCQLQRHFESVAEPRNLANI